MVNGVTMFFIGIEWTADLSRVEYEGPMTLRLLSPYITSALIEVIKVEVEIEDMAFEVWVSKVLKEHDYVA